MCEPITSTNDATSIEPADIFLDAIDTKQPPIVDESAEDIDDDFSFLSPNSRKVLPGTVPTRRLSVWSYVKEFVGKDLTRITLPIWLNEPLSLLHKVPECYTATHLFRSAINATNPVDRIEIFAAQFAISQSSHSHRTYKPFNPLLGETYELRRPEKDLLFFTEQISHHPPITAFYTEMPRFRGYGSFSLKIAFHGNSVDSIIDGEFVSEFRDENGCLESFITTRPPYSTARNIMIGSIWMEKHGMVPFVDHITGYRLTLHFRKKGWFSNRDQFFFDGMIVDKQGKPHRYIYGHWTDEVWSCSPETCKRIESGLSKRKGPDSKLIVRAIPKLPNANLYYGMPHFSMCLNELRKGMNPAPTDTRFRPDIVCLENGDLERASAEKHRLEEKQRAARRLREANGETWTPLWFDLKENPISKREEWQFNFKYLEQNFEKCPDIY